jgi:predicted nucleotidyltransferase
MASLVEVDQRSLDYLCRRYDVQRISLFGSVLREDFGPHSDVDAIVEFEPGRTPGFGFVRLQRELSELVGRQVDLHTYHSLSRYFRDEVMRESEILYERLPRVS